MIITMIIILYSSLRLKKNYGLTLANIEILPLPAEPRMDIKRGMDHATKIVLEELVVNPEISLGNAMEKPWNHPWVDVHFLFFRPMLMDSRSP